MYHDFDSAAPWYRKAAERNHPEAQLKMSFFYLNGITVERSDSQAVYWVRQAADQGSPAGKYILATMYLDGRGTAKDYSKAIKLFHEAAEKFQVDAMLSLGELYENGRGVTQNNIAALMWYSIAVRGVSDKVDNSEIQSRIETVMRKLTPEQAAKSENLAMACLRQSLRNCDDK